MALRLDRDQVKQLLKQGRIIATPDLLIELGDGPDALGHSNGRRAHPGRCEELGFSPKSIWEKNFGHLRMLAEANRAQIQEWEYEPVVFTFDQDHARHRNTGPTFGSKNRRQALSG